MVKRLSYCTGWLRILDVQVVVLPEGGWWAMMNRLSYLMVAWWEMMSRLSSVSSAGSRRLSLFTTST